MSRFVMPLISVVAGVATSKGLQALGTEPLWAKLAGLAVVLAVLAFDWRRRRRAVSLLAPQTKITVRPEPVEGPPFSLARARTSAGLRQAQPERGGVA